jgi:pimeloyl-ACP methyl ester carboxylesterase
MKIFPKHSPSRRILLLVVTVYLSVTLLAVIFQRNLLYFPWHHSDDGSLKNWTVGGEVIGKEQLVDSPQAVWLICHGNKGQAASHDYMLPCIPEGQSAYILEYPGFGPREGSPGMDAINDAAETAYTALRAAYPTLPVYVMGESLGTGPASHLATLPVPPDRIVLVVPYDTLVSVAQEHYWYLPVSLLLCDRWDNIRSLAHYKGPVDIYAAAGDQKIPTQHARNLAAHIPQARYHELPGGHNDWSDSIGRLPPPAEH